MYQRGRLGSSPTGMPRRFMPIMCFSFMYVGMLHQGARFHMGEGESEVLVFQNVFPDAASGGL